MEKHKIIRNFILNTLPKKTQKTESKNLKQDKTEI